MTDSKLPLPLQYLERPNTQATLIEALPSHMDFSRLNSTVKTALRQTPALAKVSPQSFVGAVIQLASLGLDPTGALGHAYLLPYGKKCQLIIGYKGMIELAYRSGKLAQPPQAKVVREGDEFDYAFGLEPKLNHKPSESPDGAVTHVYAIAHLKDGGAVWEVMTTAEINKIRDGSPSAKNGPWVTHWDEMAKKTVIRRLFKYLPVSVEIQSAVGLDEMADAGVDQKLDVIDGESWEIEDEPVEEKPKSMKGRAQEAVAKSKGKQGASTTAVDDQNVPDPDAALQADLIAKLDEVDEVEGLAEVLASANLLPEELAAPVMAKADEVADRINS